MVMYLSIALTGCKRDKEIDTSQPLQPVFAGKVSSDMHYVDFEPDIDLDTLSVNPNNLRLDLNRDAIDDISITVFRYSSGPGIQFFSLNSQANKIGFSCSNVTFGFLSGGTSKYCSGVVTAITLGTRIENNTCKWSVTDSMSADNFILINGEYKYKYYFDPDSVIWEPLPNQYIGFRFIENKDTLYGWMRLSIIGKAHIVIHDLAYQKR